MLAENSRAAAPATVLRIRTILIGENDMTTEQNHNGASPERNDRKNGRYQGQGWYLEDLAQSALRENGYYCCNRVFVWGKEVDILAVPDDMFPVQVEPPRSPPRVIVSCIDWFRKPNVTPARLWRLISLAFTVRAEPVLVHNHRTQLTDTSQHIAERWRVRLVSDKDLKRDWILPRPERPEYESNSIWPSPMLRSVKVRYTNKPDYSLPDCALEDQE
jgi:hypothetical protein